MDEQTWTTFDRISKSRRAVKHFNGEKLADSDVRDILCAAQQAPSSFNLQPYALHWVRDPSVCDRMRAACKGQRAAATASAFVVVVAKWHDVLETYCSFLQHVESSGLYDDRSKKYFLERRKEIAWFPRIMPLCIFGWIKAIVSLFTRHFVMAPIGNSGLYQWAARNSIFAAHALLLAAQAKGIDTCPMEGFNAFKVARILGVKRGVIPVVIALGKRKAGEPLTPHWRKSFDEAVNVH